METPLAIGECLAVGLEGVRGRVAESKAYSRQTLGLCLEPKIDLVTLVPRTGAIRQALEAWGQQQLALPLLGEKPGADQGGKRPAAGMGQASCGRWRSSRVINGSCRKRCALSWCIRVNWRSSKPSPLPAAQVKEAEAVADHVRQGHARWFACRPDAEAAIAAYEGRGQGRRGRRPRPWRYHTLRYGIVAESRRTRRARRGRPAKADPAPPESGYRVVGEVEVLRHPEEDNGWTVLATTVRPEEGTDTEMLQAYQDQTTTVEPGLRWIKTPAAIAPVWLEKPERLAALALLTVIGLLVYSIMQRQVRLYLHTQGQQVPGNKGATATPTAAVVLSLLAQVALVQ